MQSASAAPATPEERPCSPRQSDKQRSRQREHPERQRVSAPREKDKTDSTSHLRFWRLKVNAVSTF